MRLLTTTAAIFTLFAHRTPLLAQGEGPSAPDRVQAGPRESVVIAPRSEQPLTTSDAKVEVVTGEDLVATGERSLPKALGEAAGVWIQESNLGGGAPVLRGLLGNQILILLDGVRVNDSTTRFGPNQNLNTIDPAIVDRVEVIRGSRSVLYGSDAIGGVVSIWTKRARPTGEGRDPELHGGVGLEYVSASDGGSATTDLSFAAEDWGAIGVLSGWDWDDLEAADGEVQGATGYDGVGAFGSAEVALGGKSSLRVMTMVHRDFDVPRTFSLVPGFGQTEASHQRYTFSLQERESTVLTYDDRDPGPIADRCRSACPPAAPSSGATSNARAPARACSRRPTSTPSASARTGARRWTTTTC